MQDTFKYVYNKLKGHEFIPCDYCREEKIIFLFPSVFLMENPAIKGRLSREKETSLLTCIPHPYIGDT